MTVVQALTAGRVGISRWREKISRPFVLLLLLAASFYWIPNVLGYGWSPAGGPRFLYAGPGPTIRTPAYGYQSITAEAWGAAIISVPFNAHLRDYLHHTELPLWNPYQALGQPFAAQGEGSPYSPLAIIRALLPLFLHNFYNTLLFAASALFSYALCRRLNISEASSRFVAVCWMMSPALSWHIARDNYVDQFSLIPVLFWAVTRAVSATERYPWPSTSLLIGLFCVGGFVQTAMVALIAGYLYAIFLVMTDKVRLWPERWLRTTKLTASFVLGVAIAAPFLLPVEELVQVGYAKNWLSFSLNFDAKFVYAFFLPDLFGAPFTPPPNDGWYVWGDSYAALGMVVTVIAVSGLTIDAWKEVRIRRLARFFLFVAAVLLLRALNVPPFSALNALPVVGLQTPKHAHSLIAFLMLIACGFHLDNAQLRKSLTLGILLVPLFVAAVYGDAFAKLYYMAPYSRLIFNAPMVSYLLVLLMGLASLVMIVVASRTRYYIERAKIIDCLAVIAVGELSFYFLLGVEDALFYVKFCTALALSVGALFLLYDRLRLSVTAIGVGMATYAVLVAWPSKGLPTLASPAPTPGYVRAIEASDPINYRSFGIPPDFSSMVRVQDISVASAFTTMEFNTFVKLVANDSEETLFSFANSMFMLASRTAFPIREYLTWKPVFDWFGVRCLVFDKAFFGPNGGRRTDYLAVMDDHRRFRLVYDDDYASVVQVKDAQPKVIFSPNYEIVRSRAEIFRRLLRDPTRILGTPMVEAAQAQAAQITAVRSSEARQVPIPVAKYSANRIRFRVEASQPGIAIVRDSFFPGWHARVDGAEAPTIRVNGMARGVIIAEAGSHEVEMTYFPDSFRTGLLLALLALSALSVVVIAPRLLPGPGLWITISVVTAACAVIVAVFPLAAREERALRAPAVGLKAAETFAAFDLRNMHGLVPRLNIATDDRSLITRRWGRAFPSALIGATPLPLISGDVFVGPSGDLVEVDTDSQLIDMAPAEGTRVCLLDTTVRGRDDWDTTTLPIPIVGMMHYSSGHWIPDELEETDRSACAQAIGRIRFGWMNKKG
jgi:hypothetical protein